ncbi:MAG: NAD(P)H-dependent oxidoreductase [Bacteroidia bacterium]
MITILSGSPRKNSNTLRVAKAIQHLAKESEEEVRVIDFNGFDIPSANVGSVNKEALSEWQKSLYESCRDSDLVFILTPEYNWFPSAEIIHMIHSMASTQFKDMWDNKVFATCGTSSGRGGRMPAVQLSYTLNKILNVFHCESVVSPKIFESQFTSQVLDENGMSLGNTEYMNGLQMFVDFNLKLRNRWRGV